MKISVPNYSKDPQDITYGLDTLVYVNFQLKDNKTEKPSNIICLFLAKIIPKIP